MDLSGENWGIKNKPDAADGLILILHQGRKAAPGGLLCIVLGNKDTFWVSGQLDKTRT